MERMDIMDEIVVRPKYSRPPSTPRKRKRQQGNDLMPTVFAAKLLVVVVFLSVFALCKAADTPVTNYFISRVKVIATDNFDTNKYIVRAVTALGIKLPEKPAVAVTQGQQDLGTGAGDDIPASGQAGSPDNIGNASPDGTQGGAQGNIQDNSQTNGQVQDTPSSSINTVNGDENVSDNIKAMNQVPVLEEKEIAAMAQKYSFIIPVNGDIASPFGIRTDPLSGATQFHSGIDIAANMGTSIKAALAGEVVEVGSSPEYDNYIKIKHNDGIYTVYAHCSILVAKQGQKVNQGDVVAKVGDTEGLSGAYLHFEVWKDDKAVDPEKLLSLLNR